jgi:hypothetical protein
MFLEFACRAERIPDSPAKARRCGRAAPSAILANDWGRAAIYEELPAALERLHDGRVLSGLA